MTIRSESRCGIVTYGDGKASDEVVDGLREIEKLEDMVSQANDGLYYLSFFKGEGCVYEKQVDKIEKMLDDASNELFKLVELYAKQNKKHCPKK